MKRKYHYFFFDADGTLFDTTELIYKCFLYTLKRFNGPKRTKKEIISNIGLTLRGQMEVYFGPLSDTKYNEMAKEHMAHQLSIYKRYLKLFPGVLKGLKQLIKQGKHCVVVSSRKRDTLDLYLKETKIYNFFELIISPEQTENHKPHGEPVLKALSLLNIRDKSKVLMVGDSEFDILCGYNAGVDTCFVKWSKNSLKNFSVKPTYSINKISELLSL